MAEPKAHSSYQNSAHFRLRLIADRFLRYAVAAGGNSVIVAILLIFFYLLYIVMPLGESPDMREEAQYPLVADAPIAYMAMEEQAEVGMLVEENGKVAFLSTHDGKVLAQMPLPLPAGVTVVSFSAARPNSAIVALGLSNGQAVVIKPDYQVTYPNDKRLITPRLLYPLGEAPIDVGTKGEPLRRLAIQYNESYVLVGWSGGDLLSIVRTELQESMLGDEAAFEFNRFTAHTGFQDIEAILVDPARTDLYVVSKTGALAWYDLKCNAATLHEQLKVTADGLDVLDVAFLSGGTSLMVLSGDGRLGQWFAVRDAGGVRHLQLIRSFHVSPGASHIVPEFSRKGFLVADHSGGVGVYHATAHRHLIQQPVSQSAIVQLAMAPRANALWALDADIQLHFWRIRNEYPVVSWESLWSKVWYEGYDKPAYIWQSSSADNEFEPKFSLTPLTFGTLKAAFYAMLFAIPLSILGAIFTAYFMAPKMRQFVKPSIEIMEAMPTVILGFLAGLWLAPLVESHLPGFFMLFVILPLVVLVAAYLWSHLPGTIRQRVPDGWEAALLIPVLVLATWAALAASGGVEAALFGGDMPHWLESQVGMGFDQRNSIVVGLAMGFAVIPTIFSIAEDAIFSVPKHLSNGSLALGATTWQTLVRVVLLTASPGIFSAIMMGVGRAVGETMIVLMATGNTPVMDMSIFQGMRTLSANIAVEMPEAEVASTHYRVLFLAGLVLFLFTFVFNTGAELVRQRLRTKYSSL